MMGNSQLNHIFLIGLFVICRSKVVVCWRGIVEFLWIIGVILVGYWWNGGFAAVEFLPE